MTEKEWKIIDEEFISYTGGTAQLISNGECKVHLWETPKDAQLFCDKLNEQYKTIQSLHKTIEELDNCQKGQSHRINDLYLENKQLKDLITHLGYTIKYDGYRHISLELKR